VAVPIRKSTASCCTSWDVTAAARAEEDWLSTAMISTVYFLPPTVSPLASAERTWPSTYPLDWVNTDSCPVSGLTKPILMVPPPRPAAGGRGGGGARPPAPGAPPPPPAAPPRRAPPRHAEETASADQALALLSHAVIVGRARPGGLAPPGTSLDHPRIGPQS